MFLTTTLYFSPFNKCLLSTYYIPRNILRGWGRRDGGGGTRHCSQGNGEHRTERKIRKKILSIICQTQNPLLQGKALTIPKIKIWKFCMAKEKKLPPTKSKGKLGKIFATCKSGKELIFLIIWAALSNHKIKHPRK